MADMSTLLKLIKKTALEAVSVSQPCVVLYGTIKSINPLKIKLDENGKIILTKNFLVLTKNIRKMALDVEDKVLLLRIQGGGKYVILDKL